jgi:hypothetical protein
MLMTGRGHTTSIRASSVSTACFTFADKGAMAYLMGTLNLASGSDAHLFRAVLNTADDLVARRMLLDEVDNLEAAEEAAVKAVQQAQTVTATLLAWFQVVYIQTDLWATPGVTSELAAPDPGQVVVITVGSLC